MSEGSPDPAATHNYARYADAEVVAGYIREPYHDVRVTIAADLLARQAAHWTGAERVADLGAGGGFFASKISHLTASVACCDISVSALRHARAAGFGVLLLDVTASLPFGTGSLDAIYAGEVVEHLFDPGGFLAECRRCLKTAGILVLTTPNLATAQDRIRFLAGRSPRQVNPYHSYLRLHIRPFTPHALRSAIRTAGFEPRELRSNYVRWYAGSGYAQSRWLARMCPALGGSLIVSAVAT